MNAVVPISHEQRTGRSLTAVDVREHVNLIQEVMAAVMKKDTHYGVIPGCKQPSLYKAGSEVLLTTFRIAVSVHVEDLSTADAIRYRVRTVGTHQGSGIVVGEGIGECSSDEEKYKWRRCYNKKEFDATAESRRRIKFTKYGEDMQVRTEPADVANTVLKMAKKRAQIDLTLTATAASDIFTQDVEDIPEEIRDEQNDVDHTVAADAQAKARHDEAYGRHSESISYIKERLAEDDLEPAAKEWAEISQDDQRALWLATTKGGCFTTAERKTIKERVAPILAAASAKTKEAAE
jgi:hypothetical protein